MKRIWEAQRRGFSIPELLLAISIISLFASIIMFSVRRARGSSRDANRLAGLLQLQVAIEFYYSQNGVYPSPCSSTAGWAGANLTYGGCVTNYIQGLTPTYISVLPLDPGGYGGVNFGYIYSTFNSGQDYKLMAYGVLENVTMNPGDKYFRCPTTCDSGTYPKCYGPPVTNFDGNVPKTYAVYSPGAACQ